MALEDDCNMGLVLGLGLTSSLQTNRISQKKPCLKTEPAAPTPPSTSLEPSLTLGLSSDANQGTPTKTDVQKALPAAVAAVPENSPRQASPLSVVSSFSNVSPKRERDVVSEEMEVEKVSSRASDEDEENINTRKKLRLTKEQSALLEDSFKQHSTLNPKQKQALARQLNLRPRQVEVWFQNRRARTKLKQTELDCELLKKYCETLKDENRRLQKELQELKAIKLANPFYMHMTAATLTMCPSCERIGGAIADNPTKSPFSMAPKPHFFNPFTKPSAAY